MSVELAQKSLTIEEVYDIAVNYKLVKVGKILSNELSNSIPKKIKAQETDYVDLKVDKSLRKVEYLRAYLLITLSNLCRMKKAGRKSIVELITILLNRKAIPLNAINEDSNIIETLIKTLIKDGQVELNGETKNFTEVIELPSEENDEEEEKKELPEQVDKVSPQELFIMNSKRNYQLAVLAVELTRIERLTKKLFTSFSLSSQALSISADAFSTITITQGLNSKQAQTIKNSLLAMVDKSQALGKKSDKDSASQVYEMFNLLINVIQYTLVLSSNLKAEVNTEVHALFSDKKADSMQVYIDRENTSVDQLVNGLNETLLKLLKSKNSTLSALGTESPISDLEKISQSTANIYSKLVTLLENLEDVTTKEEFVSYQNLKTKDDE